ncbi:DUF488 domain-containing protein [Streptomyces apocyni]|uniref:DUF488 domain-containing protein n=1 Tax=Streptomyces apocyni TaxID=2654677 RepID=UPI0012EAC31D|nr:DUF488 family protein [Streptomyces apocyni]
MSQARHRVQVRRIYDPPEPDDGQRVLVDRLWPRGVSKADAHLNEWLKAVTPSAELRRWYHSSHASFDEFARRYEAELTTPEAAQALNHLRDLATSSPLTLLTAARDPDHSHTAVLLRHL